MPKLDGTEKITHTPYDAHEQVVRKPHTHSIEEGYQPVQPQVEAPDVAAEEKEGE